MDRIPRSGMRMALLVILLLAMLSHKVAALQSAPKRTYSFASPYPRPSKDITISGVESPKRSYSFTSPYPRPSVPMKRVVITGAGPAGLLTAHALLSRRVNDGTKYKVQVYEQREDPRKEIVGPRAYSLGLNIRGQHAVNYFDKSSRSEGLWKAIEAKGVKSDSFWLHIGKNKFNIRKPVTKPKKDDPPPTLLIPRNKLTSAMVDELERLYPDRCEIHFEQSLDEVDMVAQTCRTSMGKEESFDLLVGADGVASIVRSAMASSSTSDAFKTEDEVLPGGYKVMIRDCPPSLDQNSVHAMEATAKDKAGFGLFMIPAPPADKEGNNTMCTLIAWPKEQPAVIESGSDEEIQAVLLKDFPQLETVTLQQVGQLSAQRPSSAKLIRCNRYHDEHANVMLIGDAAHSTGGTLGQGANSALLDVVAFDQALDKTKDDIPAALEVFSSSQVEEGQALWTLLQLKPANLGMPFGPLYSLLQLVRGFRSKLFSAVLRLAGGDTEINAGAGTGAGTGAGNGAGAGAGARGWFRQALARAFKPLLKKPVQTALSQTLTPFSQIVAQNEWWVSLALKKTGRALTIV